MPGLASMTSVSKKFFFSLYIKSCLTITSLIIRGRVSRRFFFFFSFTNMSYVVLSSGMNFANLLHNGFSRERESAFLFQRETLSTD